MIFKPTKTLIKIFLLWTLVGVLTKPVFLFMYSSLAGNTTVFDWLQVMWHGMKLDLAIAGYISIIPALLLIANIWIDKYCEGLERTLSYIWKGFFALISFTAAVGFSVNLGLYGYWGFPLDTTPILYIKTSPSDAMASITLWGIIGEISAIIAFSTLFTWLSWHYAKLPEEKENHRFLSSFSTLICTGLLIIPIRGGFGTGTNHVGTVYYSTNMNLNHAAVNPLFSFFEALDHQEDLSSKYRFMEDKKASELFKSMTYTKIRTDSVNILNGNVKNVVIIMLESFSKYIMSGTGQTKGVTPNLNKLAAEGIYFTNFYANSFRTDRALVSIQSGLPAQPTMSIMDMPHKSTSLPSIAKTLDREGWTTSYYYGGDMNFCNMQSYFIGTGFQKVTSDKDFPLSLNTSKWGVADGPVYDRMLADIKGYKGKAPQFRVIMTESSHEPYDVPYHKFNSLPLNAFSYADFCLGKFIFKLKKLQIWRNTLVVILPDHLQAYPKHLDNFAFWRYQIPMIMIGGVVKKPLKVHTVSCQTDLPATLLTLLGYNHDDFLYSKDIFDNNAPHFAFFTNDDLIGIVTENSQLIYDNTSNKIIKQKGSDIPQLLDKAKAYLQKLYDDIDAR